MQGPEQPRNTLEFIWIVIKTMISSIPQIIKFSLVSALISFIVSNAIHLYLMGWVNDGWTLGNNPTINALIFGTGQETSPRVMLFYFLLNYAFWWTVNMFRTKGITTTIQLIVTTPIWVTKSLLKTGLSSLPLLLGGITISFIIGLGILTGPSSIMMFLLTLTWLISQDQSLVILGLQFGFNDIRSLFNKQPDQFPDKAVPVVAILGSSIGFAYMTFFTPNTNAMLVFVLLTIAVAVYMVIQNRRKDHTALLASLLLLLFAVALSTQIVFADDGGIPENGGWSSVTGGGWLRDQLISAGYPASIVGTLGSLIASFLSPPSIWGNVQNIQSDADHTYPGTTRTGGMVDYPTTPIRDAAGNITGYTQTGNGLPQVIIDAEDSDNYGPAIRVYTQPPPRDQEQMDNITEGIRDMGTRFTNQLHPDVWRTLSPEEKGQVLNRINNVINEEFGTNHTVNTFSNPQRPTLLGNFDPNTNKINLNTSSAVLSDPREAVRTLIHEGRHSNQWNQRDATGSEYQQMNQYNWSNYTTSQNDYVSYGEQFIERDSRNFSSLAANQLINELNEAAGNQ